MSPGSLRERLEGIPVPAAAAARERTVAAARAQVVGGRSAPARGLRPIRLLAATLLLAAALLSPPGRAATNWVADLVRGEGPGGLEVTSPPVVIDSGTAPGGARYAWIAYGCKINMHGEGVPVRFRGYSLSLVWPDSKRRGGGCEGHGKRALETTISPAVLARVPASRAKNAQPDLFVSGRTSPAVRRMRAVYTDRAGRRQELPVDFKRVTGRLRQRAGLRRSTGLYVAFVPGPLAAGDGLADCVGAFVLGRDGRRNCPPRPGGASPIELIGFDARGRELRSIGVPLSPKESRALRPPGPSRAEIRRRTRRQRRGSILLLGGRAPGGAAYEFRVKLQRERSGKVFGVCIDEWWRGLPRGGFCGPGLPSPGAFGRRAAAKGFGLLTEQRATRRLSLSGFARSSVARVRVVYLTRRGARRDAPVKLARVRGSLLRRVGAKRPFGLWMSFLPRYLAGAKGAHGRPAIEVIAYDSRGRQLSRVAQRTKPINQSGVRVRRGGAGRYAARPLADSSRTTPSGSATTGPADSR